MSTLVQTIGLTARASADQPGHTRGGSTRTAGFGAHLAFVDCARGYAILMVITSHLTYCYPGLPFPVSRVAMNGWYGVQLFFLASCFTLLRSWHAELSRARTVDISGFLLRRLFRIAPAYYAAAVLYFIVAPPPGGFEPEHAAIWAVFLNGWTPDWAGVDGGWQVVPGGWSVSAEFAFYLLFPLFAAIASSMRRAVAVVLASIVLGAVVNIMADNRLSGHYGHIGLGNFLYGWPPNQLSVFAIGGVVFFILGGPAGRTPAWLDRLGPAIAWASAALFVATLYLPHGHFLGDWPLLPEPLVACIPLACLFIGLASGRGLLVNRIVARIGRVSFSAYLLHFAVLPLTAFIPSQFGADATSYDAIVAFAIGWASVVGVTIAVASLSFTCIEAPMMTIGKHLILRLRAARAFPPPEIPARGTGAPSAR